METKTDILVTRELSEKQLSLAGDLGLNPIMRPAIHVEFEVMESAARQWPEADNQTPWVFTSKNGVEGYRRFAGRRSASDRALNSALGGDTGRPVYAVGRKTASALDGLGLKAVTPETEDAGGLAALIIEDLKQRVGPPQVIHWCGNRSRKELGTLLRKAGIELKQRVVYRTGLNRVELPEKPVDGILFFSPSAVEAFRHSGGFRQELPPLFAVGHTTARALGLESNASVHVPDKPSTETLLRLAARILQTT